MKNSLMCKSESPIHITSLVQSVLAPYDLCAKSDLKSYVRSGIFYTDRR